MAVHVFGIRHHGPGCARSLLAALEALDPDIVLVEGPPDAHEVLSLLMHERMQPPVALLVYAPDAPKRAAFYPFTHFSPEWQALRYAFGHGIPARFIDLPQAICLAEEEVYPSPDPSPGGEGSETVASETVRSETVAPNTNEHQDQGLSSEKSPDDKVISLPSPQGEGSGEGLPIPSEGLFRDDPIGILAEAAGYSDHELWWEQQIEQRQDSTGLFAGIMEAMTALRQSSAPATGHEARREAHMRQSIRTAQKEGFERIAVVCGAWHAPVLADPGPARADTALLAKLPRVKVEATWIPWTNGRLSYRSGYGAGVQSPGWYSHLWTAPDRVTIRWMARAAALLRAEDLMASSSNVIEAVRLADALAALRGLPMPGLAELNESIQTVLCGGDGAPMRLIRDRLEIGEALGEVPEETPAVPLQADLEAHQRRLRLKPSAEIKPFDLDLRNETDRARSHLLHRLNLLSVGWGKAERVSGKSGTFHELWTLQWQPEYVVALIEANIWGNTLEIAAGARLRHLADTSEDLARLTGLLDAAILAALPEAIDHLLVRVRDQAAISADVRRLMDALPPLARVARYGDIRETRAEQVLPVIDALFERAVVGLPGACSALDDDAAKEMAASISRAQESVDLLGQDERQAEWQAVLRVVVEHETIHGLVRGTCCRLLLEHEAIDRAELQRVARLALSLVVPGLQAAAWLEGLLRGSAFLLLQHDGLWSALDTWLIELDGEVFTTMLPLVRRAFAEFQAPERRAMGEKVKHLHTAGSGPRVSPGDAATPTLDHERAALVLPVLATIVGVETNAYR